MPRPYPREFRDDVVRIARNRDDGVTLEQIATDFGVHPVTLSKWMRQADVDDGAKPGASTGESAELRELRRRNRLLEQENEVLRPRVPRGWASSVRTTLPASRRAGAAKPSCSSGIPRPSSSAP
ncbi:MAG: transposase [Mycobacterium sp.]|nr:transposase [Mycobacterium sp.]MDT5181835.1 transposase [Mycobacterium sp.]